MQRINEGDIVQLNSGSPNLKVKSVTNSEITVEWTTQATFPLPCVVPVENEGLGLSKG
jgi:hypothetical protein